MGMYFDNDPNIKSETRIIDYYINNTKLTFVSDNGVFCKDYIDFGTSLLIKCALTQNLKGQGIDLGCGIGVIGITIMHFNSATKFDFIDVNKRALELTKINLENNKLNGLVLENNGLENINEDSKDFIITNPPIRAGKKVIYKFYEDSYKVLKNQGVLLLVIQKKQGAESTISKLNEIFGNCETIEKSKGYYILKATK